MTVKTERLRTRVLKGGLWTLTGFGMHQVIRLGSNLILTRLLFPEAFGMMALVYAVMTGLAMFSDMGLQLSIVQSKRGDDEEYLNVVWTLSILRGFLMTIAGCLLAGPVASFYGQPELFWLLCVTATTAGIHGFKSARIDWLSRHLMVARATVWQVSNQVLTLLITVGAVLLVPSVWGLVIGNVLGSIILVLTSHIVVPGARDRLAWNKTMVSEVVGFGKWIFLSTLITFLVSQGDRLLLGKLMTLEQLAMYAIAVIFSEAPVQIFHALTAKILIPIYSMLHRNGIEKEALQKIFKLRCAMILSFLPMIAMAQVLAVPLMRLCTIHATTGQQRSSKFCLSDPRPACVNGTMSPILLSSGNSRRYFMNMIAHLFFMGVGVSFGWYMGGVHGFILGIALSHFLHYPVVAYLVRPYGIWTPLLDLSALASFLVFLAWAHQLIY